MRNVDPFSAEEQRSLRRLVGIIIPASAAYGVPGADDDLIFADILATLAPDTPRVRAALRRLDALAGGRFADLEAPQRQAVAFRLRDAESSPLPPWVSVTVQCYYRDDRVMRSLGMEARPPFPKGFEVEQGDWSLLDAVRARPKLYRDAGG
jgi:hypothetical protein